MTLLAEKKTDMHIVCFLLYQSHSGKHSYTPFQNPHPLFHTTFSRFFHIISLCKTTKIPANLCKTFRDVHSLYFMLYYTHDIKYFSFGEFRRYFHGNFM